MILILIMLSVLLYFGKKIIKEVALKTLRIKEI